MTKTTDRTSQLITAANDPKTLTRYHAKITKLPETTCWLWTGAISGRGHGRFWIRDNIVVIAHRFAWILHQLTPHAAAGNESISLIWLPEVVTHTCDNPICQNPAHLRAGTPTTNRREWSQRRTTPGSPLRDLRGAHGRALALRDAARSHHADIRTVLDAGLGEIDRHQPTLW